MSSLSKKKQKFPAAVKLVCDRYDHGIVMGDVDIMGKYVFERLNESKRPVYVRKYQTSEGIAVLTLEWKSDWTSGREVGYWVVKRS